MPSTDKMRKSNDAAEATTLRRKSKADLDFAFSLFAFVTFLYKERLMTRFAGTCISANQSDQGPFAADLTGRSV